MAYNIVVTQSAEADLAAIIAYLVGELCNADAAIALLDAVEARYDVLEANPFLYARCQQPLLQPGGYRKAVIGGYLLIYRVDETRQVVYIERFFSELQDYAEKL